MKSATCALAAAVGLAAWTGGTAEAQKASARPRILQVEKLELNDDRVRGYPEVGGWHKVKYFDVELSTSTTAYEVTWEAPREGVEAGTLLLFEYRREGDRDIKAKNIKYPFAVYGERSALFLLPSNDAYDDGPVIMWRTRLVHKGRLLAEKSSDGWK